MKVTIDTDTDTLDGAVATIHAAFGVANGHKVGNGGDDAFYPGGWTKPRLQKFADYLAPDAAEAVRYIAEHAPAVSIDDVIEYMGIYTEIEDFNGKHMGGRMASVGFAIKNIHGVKSAPYDTDFKARQYVMDERIAETLLDMLTEE